MNAPHIPQDESLSRGVKIGIILVIVYLGLLLSSYALAGEWGLNGLHNLLLGWLPFLGSRLVRFQPDGPTALIGIVAFLLLVVSVHWIGTRLLRGENAPSSWRWRSTVAVSGGVLVLFASGIALIGAAHQAIWLSSGMKGTTAQQERNPWGEPPGPLNLVQWARLSATQTQSRNNLKQIGWAIGNYHDNHFSFPAGAIVDDRGHAVHGWIYPLGPYIGFYAGNHVDREVWDSSQNRKYALGALPIFVHPLLGWHGQFDEHGYAYTHYAANVHGFPNNRGLKIAEITDGTSNTLAIGEVAENFQPWASPWNRRDPADGINAVPWGFGGPPVQRGAQFVFFDGQVRLISRDVDRELLKSLGLPNDGRPISEWESRLR